MQITRFYGTQGQIISQRVSKIDPIYEKTYFDSREESFLKHYKWNQKNLFKEIKPIEIDDEKSKIQILIEEGKQYNITINEEDFVQSDDNLKKKLNKYICAIIPSEIKGSAWYKYYAQLEQGSV